MSSLITSEIHLISLHPPRKKKAPRHLGGLHLFVSKFSVLLLGKRHLIKVPAAGLWNGAQPESVVAPDSMKFLCRLTAWYFYRNAAISCLQFGLSSIKHSKKKKYREKKENCSYLVFFNFMMMIPFHHNTHILSWPDRNKPVVSKFLNDFLLQLAYSCLHIIFVPVCWCVCWQPEVTRPSLPLCSLVS